MIHNKEMLEQKKQILDALYKKWPGRERLDLPTTTREEPKEGFPILEVSVKQPDGTSKKWLPYPEGLKTYGIENITLRRIMPDEISADCDNVDTKELIEILLKLGVGFEHWSTKPDDPYSHAHLRFIVKGLEKQPPGIRKIIKEDILRELQDKMLRIPDMCCAYPCRMISVEYSKHHKRDEYLHLIKRYEGKVLELTKEQIQKAKEVEKEVGRNKVMEPTPVGVRVKWECPVVREIIEKGREADGVHRSCMVLGAWCNNGGMALNDAIDFVRKWNEKNAKPEPDTQIVNQVNFAYKNETKHVSCRYLKKEGFCKVKDCKYERTKAMWADAFKEVTKLPEKFEKELGKEGAEEEILKTSFLECDGKIYEQIYDEKNGSRFAVWDGERVSYAKSVNLNGVTYAPINNQKAIQDNVILLPEKAEEYGTTEELIKEIQKHIHKWLDVSDKFEMIATYTIPFYWLYDRFNTLHYLRALGDIGTGKSRVLDTIGRLSYKPTIVAGALTTAPIFRLIDRWKGTLIIEEADLKDSSTQADIVKILNCGFEKNRPVVRCEKEDPDNIQTFQVYGPKILATRYSFYDKALESRCITEQMQETVRMDIPDLLPPEFYKEQMALRNKLLMFRFKNYYVASPERSRNIDLGNIEPRVRQISRGILATLDDKTTIQKFVIYIEEFNRKLIQERAETFEGMILNTIFELWDEGVENISSSKIREKMIEMYHFREGKEPTTQKIGGRLRSLNINTKKKRVGKKALHIIEWEEQLMSSLHRRYIPPISDTVPSGLGKNGEISEAKETIVGSFVPSVPTVATIVKTPPPSNHKNVPSVPSKFTSPRCNNIYNIYRGEHGNGTCSKLGGSTIEMEQLDTWNTKLSSWELEQTEQLEQPDAQQISTFILEILRDSGLNLEEIYEECSKKFRGEIPKMVLEQLMEKLCREGVIYEITPGKFRRV